LITTPPYRVAWPVPGDGSRALRVVAADAAGLTREADVAVLVDRTPPTASLADPGLNLRATVPLSADAADTGGTGVGSVAFQYSHAGADSWSTIGSDTAAPYSVDFNTASGLADGLYDFRVFVTDVAGNT